jgi:hypothetical protein
MADRVLLIAWDRPVRGSEERAIDAFNEAVGLMGRRQQEGRIEGFEIVMMRPNSDLGGFFLVRGSAQQIHDLREDGDFLRSTARAQMVVDGIRHLEGMTGEAVAHQVELYREASQAIPQHA